MKNKVKPVRGGSRIAAPPQVQKRSSAVRKKGRGCALALESSGDPIYGNHWIKIGLTRSQVRTITRLGKRWSIRKSPCAVMARYLISLSLLNLDETQAKLGALVKYIEAEGFLSLSDYCDHVMRTQEDLASK